MIHHIDAHNGSIRFYKDGGVVGQANNASWIAHILKVHGGFDEYASMSSSIQFGEESGFEYDEQVEELLMEGMDLHANM